MGKTSPYRVPMVAGNWKMNTDRQEALRLAKEIAQATGSLYKIEIALCPPYVWITEIYQLIKSTRIKLGGQNIHWEDWGAFTGEISAQMLKEAGCKYVIIGHSERRQLFGETDGAVNRKLKKAIETGLSAIVCLGETLEDRESGRTQEIVERQFRESLAGIANFDKIVIAYEPVWAIGTGKNATPDQAQEVHAFLRSLLQKNARNADEIRILYGGSVKASNAGQLFAQNDIDGFLVGGASLKSAEFLGIINTISA